MDFITKWKKAISCSLCIIFIVLIIVFAPFDPDKWGTVSDWVMVIVTTVTAIYLVKTFRAQQEIRKTELTPHFELYLENGKYMLRLKSNTAFNIKGYPAQVIDNIKPIPIWHSYMDPVHVHAKPASNVGDKLIEKTRIEYEDVSKNKYQQTIYHTEDVLVIFPPQEI
ncbi:MULTISPECIES: hypothetical protein [Sphingobacterium]|uniref:hypothetical protein n=1 Tax=Sphingobacterium TaxID=28453 RepID=UPI00258026CE|nr:MULTISPECIES: hypothetical protein [Sphingobacterium]